MEHYDFTTFAAKRVDEDLRVIDVREENEWAEVHLKGAEHFALSRLEAGEFPEADGRDVALICRSGARSQKAGALLEQRGGFGRLVNVDGGTLAAVEAGESYVTRGGAS